jgi:hypothetical protein
MLLSVNDSMKQFETLTLSQHGLQKILVTYNNYFNRVASYILEMTLVDIGLKHPCESTGRGTYSRHTPTAEFFVV